ncbi:glutathione S-transferase [Ferrimonas sp. YFM]|uniref:glutathione S-transferase n=1 Tax=Ferrimonas sp. YFM TaxID=3028878 RepID=UPI0025723EC0|nr:glutathione S-transferase [Ferrimonas sp. YFM]BDY05403.1 glutathione S-transferase [Ferrimonas sp. YFM]
MKLFLNTTSPYARLVRIIAIEKGIESHIQLVWSDPWENEPKLLSFNPIGKVPTLITQEGTPIFETLLIVHYLNDCVPNNELIPSKAQAYHLIGHGLGLIDTAFALVSSRRFDHPNAKDTFLDKRRITALQRTLHQLEINAEQLLQPGRAKMGELAIAVAIDYIRFRLNEIDLDTLYPRLCLWQKTLLSRPSFQTTRGGY